MKHSQRPDISHEICPSCKRDECYKCVDVTLALLGRKLICRCTRQKHDGEPIREQVLDPDTGTVHAPGLVVFPDGEVMRRG